MDLAIDTIKDDIVQVVGFYVGKKLLGADIMSVREILRDPVIDAYDDPSGVITGKINLRGQTIPTLDLNQRMGGQPGQRETDWVLIAHIGDQVVGLVADAVTQIFRINHGSVLPAPDIILSGMNTPYVRGVFESKLGMLVVLDVDRLLTGDEIEAIKNMGK